VERLELKSGTYKYRSTILRDSTLMGKALRTVERRDIGLPESRIADVWEVMTLDLHRPLCFRRRLRRGVRKPQRCKRCTKANLNA
jgi:hypothetical protein